MTARGIRPLPRGIICGAAGAMRRAAQAAGKTAGSRAGSLVGQWRWTDTVLAVLLAAAAPLVVLGAPLWARAGLAAVIVAWTVTADTRLSARLSAGLARRPRAARRRTRSGGGGR